MLFTFNFFSLCDPLTFVCCCFMYCSAIKIISHSTCFPYVEEASNKIIDQFIMYEKKNQLIRQMYLGQILIFMQYLFFCLCKNIYFIPSCETDIYRISTSKMYILTSRIYNSLNYSVGYIFIFFLPSHCDFSFSHVNVWHIFPPVVSSFLET